MKVVFFIYTITDSETGVNYIGTKYGITPRLNADGSIHLTNKEIFEKINNMHEVSLV